MADLQNQCDHHKLGFATVARSSGKTAGDHPQMQIVDLAIIGTPICVASGSQQRTETVKHSAKDATPPDLPGTTHGTDWSSDTRATQQAPAIGCGPLRERVRHFERYLPPVLTRWILDEGDTARVSPVEREVTVMFTDISGFTVMAEKRSATAVADFLNDHFALVADAVESVGGTVDKFLGDGVMAFWLAESDPAHHTANAARAALNIAGAVKRNNRLRQRQGEPGIRMRIGVQTGPAVIGSIGAGDRMAFTIVGNTVNMAQRLEQRAKSEQHAQDVTILLGESLAGRLPATFHLNQVRNVPLEQDQRSIRAYRLVAEGRHESRARPGASADEHGRPVGNV